MKDPPQNGTHLTTELERRDYQHLYAVARVLGYTPKELSGATIDELRLLVAAGG